MRANGPPKQPITAVGKYLQRKDLELFGPDKTHLTRTGLVFELGRPGEQVSILRPDEGRMDSLDRQMSVPHQFDERAELPSLPRSDRQKVNIDSPSVFVLKIPPLHRLVGNAVANLKVQRTGKTGRRNLRGQCAEGNTPTIRQFDEFMLGSHSSTLEDTHASLRKLSRDLTTQVPF